LRKELARPERKHGSTTQRPSALIELSDEASLRFSSLRQWRAEAAREQNVPAYVIFHDATLRHIAEANPKTRAALAKINGVGGSKLERYGEDVLDALGAV
jgi:ATP-dependent DNA helicase RecQ